MNAKTVIRTVVFLLLLFVVLYTGMTNPHKIDFNFPLLLDKKVTQPAALLFFVMFAIGVVAGMVLNGGAPAKRSGEAPAKSRK
jgi:uncharacterized membrane protein YciS (DUF1049 family)